jgi:CHASE2 domain
MTTTYHLKVYKLEQMCLFELTWGRGQQFACKVAYPDDLKAQYEAWQRAYLGYYKTQLRGRPGVIGEVMAQPIDWFRRVQESEISFLKAFQTWLRSQELYEMRAHLTGDITLFLTCEPLELARLPWELSELVTNGSIRIVRAPTNIHAPISKQPKPRRAKPSVLVIWGDDTNLEMSCDRNTLLKYSDFLHLVELRRHPEEKIADLKQRIYTTIEDAQGWDMLFFFGHSNEAALEGGHIAISPEVTLSIQDISAALRNALNAGLSFALFNSCSGLDIAERLISMGLDQIVVMREPIHNEVAHVFLQDFLAHLHRWVTVDVALQSTCQTLKQDKYRLKYPSAYLIPSLFYHPDASPFYIEPQGYWPWLKSILPTRVQVAAISLVAVISLLPGVQKPLLSGRLLSQAVYRQVTGQLSREEPPVTLVAVDSDSVRKSPLLLDPNPINRQYLAQLIDALPPQSGVIGVDYLLEGISSDDGILTDSVKKQVASGAWVVFGSILSEGKEVGPFSENLIGQPNWSLQGYTDTPPGYVVLPWQKDYCLKDYCPFSYLLAITYLYQTEVLPEPITDLKTSGKRRLLPKPALDSLYPNLRKAMLGALTKYAKDDTKSRQLAQMSLSPITRNARSLIGLGLEQFWLQPILDFSLPPDQIFRWLPAHQILAATPEEVAKLIPQNSLVIIGAGGYDQSGGGENAWQDYAPVPPAIGYGRSRSPDMAFSEKFTGLESNAYMVHHLLNQHWVIPIPDLWAVGVAAIGGGCAEFWMRRRRVSARMRLGIWSVTTVLYGLAGLQVFVTAKLLLPWVFPTATFWIYYGLPSQGYRTKK